MKIPLFFRVQFYAGQFHVEFSCESKNVFLKESLDPEPFHLWMETIAQGKFSIGQTKVSFSTPSVAPLLQHAKSVWNKYCEHLANGVNKSDIVVLDEKHSFGEN